MYDFLTIVRYAVFSVFCLAALAATGSWLVRTQRVSPFGALGRSLRTLTDPLVRPVETRLVRLGGNPVNAGWWLVVVVAIGGVVLISLLHWLIGVSYEFAAAARGGPQAILTLLVFVTYRVLVVALFARVIASWFGFFRYARWMRPAYWLTDWLVEPIRRILPPAGPLDWSPLVAWLVLWLLQRFLLQVVLS